MLPPRHAIPRAEECLVLDGVRPPDPRPPEPRPPEPRRTRANILAAAREVFAEKGYSGAHVNEIVERAGSTKPMIYYHFRSKEGLFAAVLEEVYAGMRQIEKAVRLTGSALEAMRELVEVTFDYHAAHPDWIRIISVANIHDAEHIVGSATIASRNSAVVAILERLLAQGAREGVFRRDVDPVHLHLLIASYSFYRVSNRHTWKIIFNRDLTDGEDSRRQRAVLVDAVLNYLTTQGRPG